MARSGEPVIRQAVTQAMRILGRQFVMGRDIDEALERAEAMEKRGYRYSYDMLGEAARTARRCRALCRAPTATPSPPSARRRRGRGPIAGARHLGQALGAASALRVRAARPRAAASWCRGWWRWRQAAKAADIGFTIDAEEADRLDLSLDLIEAVAATPALERLGRARPRDPGLSEARLPLIDWLADWRARTSAG